MQHAQRTDVVLFGGSFNPPGKHHALIATALSLCFSEVVVIPCGVRTAKSSTACIGIGDRKRLVELGFVGIPGLKFDFTDLESGVFTPTWLLEERYAGKDIGKVWHAIGGDLVRGGAGGLSEIQRTWINGDELWQKLNFAILNHPGCPVSAKDLPPRSKLITLPAFNGRSTIIRKLLAEGLPVNGLVVPEVAEYISSNRLYRNK